MVSKPTEGMSDWFWRQLHKAGILKSQCRLVFLIDEPPAGTGNKPLVSQVRAARDRFEADIRRSTPQVVVPMGTEPFYRLTGINESIMDARGYLIRRHLFHPLPTEVWKQIGTYINASKATGAKKGDPKMKWVKEARAPLLGDDFAGLVIPTFTLDHVRTEQFAVTPAFVEDIRRAERAYSGRLQELVVGNVIHEVENLPEPTVLDHVIAVDIETHGIDNEVIDLVSFSDGDVTAVLEWTEGSRAYIERVFALPDRIFAFHNSPFDLPRLVANGVAISQSVIDTHVFCTMFGAVQIQPDLHKALGRVASLYLDIEPWKTSSRKEVSHWRAMVKADPKRYAAKDAFNTHWIAVQLLWIMKDLGAWRYFMGRDGHPGPGVMATLPELAEMSRGGLRTNREFAEEWVPKLKKRLFRYLKLWTKMFPHVRFSSNPQLNKLLYREWGLPVQRSKEDGASVDELALIKLQAYVRDQREDKMIPGKWQADPRACPRTFDLMLAMRDTSKTLSTYVQPLAESLDTWVHPSYLPASKDDERGARKGKNDSGMGNKGTTATGRLASYKPNIQNQPKEVRVLYLPDRDDMCLMQWDYKSAELYVLAGMSGDEVLFDDLQHDLHQRNADRHGIERKTAKNVTYASQYLASPGKQSEMILEQSHVYVSPAECLAVSEAIWGHYTKASAYKQLLVELCETQGYITNPFGRTRFFHAGRAPAAVDFIPQSVVADIIWCVMKDVAMALRSLGGRLMTTVHDSFVGCVPADRVAEAAVLVKGIMERRFDCVRKGWFIPVAVEVAPAGKPWSQVKEMIAA